MPADTEFPRSWNLNSGTLIAASPTLSIFTAPGTCQVITAVNFTIYATTAAAGTSPSTIILEDSTTSNILSILGVINPVPAGPTVSLVQWSGEIKSIVGHSLEIITGTPFPVGWNSVIDVDGYAI